MTPIVSHPALDYDPDLDTLIRNALNCEAFVFYVVDISKRSVLAMGTSCEKILGYPSERFIKGGAEFFFSITDPNIIPTIIERQNYYIQQTRLPEYEPQNAGIIAFDTRLKNNSGEYLDFYCQSIFLSFSSQLEPELCCASICSYEEELIKSSSEILLKVKARHSENYKHATPRKLGNQTIPIIYAINDRINLRITEREQQVLRHIADGKSTHEIANHLNVSINTVETHRRHLLEKFEAKNVAELIKKASKVFWLE